MSDDVVVLLEGDCVALMAAMEPESVDAIVTDPPYDLAFMGKSWDSTAVAFSPETWRQALRALKPGGHLLAFGGTRTVHRMTVAIEDAGFEVRDVLVWGYACLSDDTEVLTRDGWVQYHSASEGQHAAAFDPCTGAIRWESISAVHRYHHEGDMAEVGPSLVTLNHRVVLDSASGRVPCLPGVWSDVHAPVGVGEEGSRTRVLAGVQREASHPGPTLPSGHPGGLDSGVSTLRERPDDGTAEPGLEGRGYRVQEAWELLRGALREGAGVGAPHVPEGRVLHGAPPRDGGGLRVPVVASGGGEPREPRPEGQPVGEPHVVAGQRVSQAVGSGPVHPGDGEPDEPRLVPYAGTVWCITVPSGAFVARRNGVVFVTGNSGFPKSLDVSKAIDKAAGAKREVVGHADPSSPRTAKVYGTDMQEGPGEGTPITAPATPEAARWQGWGTALKPSWEPVVMARKPFSGSVAKNVLLHGTGALNIDATRIPTTEDLNGGAYTGSGERHDGTENWRFRNGGRSALPGDERTEAGQGMLAPGKTAGREYVQPAGRWPANTVLTDPIYDGGWDGVVGGGTSNTGANGRVLRDAGSRTMEYRHGASERQLVNDPSGTYSRFFLIPKANRAEREPDPEAAEAEGLTPQRVATHNTDGRDMENPRNAMGEGERNRVARGEAAQRARYNDHPTVKPVNLMRHLVRLVTPPGGVVLDPFNGSGATGIAAMLEGMQYIGCEQDPHYLAITRARMRSKRWVREAERLRHLREQGVFWEPERSKDKPALAASNHREPKPKHARPEGLWKEGEP